MRITLGQQISQLKTVDQSDQSLACDRLIGRGVIRLIQVQPFYGILMAKLDRFENPQLKAPFGLGWFDHQICLEYNVTDFIEQVVTETELLFWLEHEALHLVWLHPARYPRPDSLTQMATDVAVNQYVPGRVPHELTLNEIDRKWGLKLSPRLNSMVYLHRLRYFFANLRRGRSSNKEVTDRQIKKVLNRQSDDHHFWGSEPQVGTPTKLMQLKRLVKRSYQSAGAKARGTLPGKVHDQLRRITAPNAINWKAYVKIGLGSVPFGRQESRARFNRRQAYRMDLMGTVSNYVQSTSIFVDNSGSMSDSEISYLLAQLGDFLKRFPVNVNVYSFDTRVHSTGHYHANNYQQLKFVRFGGGGTRFQSIFDYCHRYLKARRNQLIIILTDGYGESRLNYYGFDNLLWILTSPKRRFSVRNPRGHVVSLMNDPWFRNYRYR